MKQWIILAEVDLTTGVTAETYEEAIEKAEKLIEEIQFDALIANINLIGVMEV